MHIFNFPKKLYLTCDYYLSAKMGSEIFHQVVLEHVETITTKERLNEYLTSFKLTGEIKHTNDVKNSYVGRELIIHHNSQKHTYPYSHTNALYEMELGKIAVYKCVGVNIHNPAREEINKKRRKTIKLCKEIQKNSKIIEWMNAREVCIHKNVIWEILEKELEPLGVDINQISFKVANWEKVGK